MTIKAIETKYAGCRFRSRLEARWAVFLDHLGIAWEYEPQGFEVSYRLTLAEGTFAYLPDFWLPELGLWVEVKGSLTDEECARLLDAAAYLSSAGGGGCGSDNSGAHDLILLGPVPKSRTAMPAPIPWRLHMHKGTLSAGGWAATWDDRPVHYMAYQAYSIANDYGGSLHSITEGSDFGRQNLGTPLLRGTLLDRPDMRLTAALTAARSARFEHGERG